MKSSNEKGFTTAWMLGLVMVVLLVGGVFYDFSGALTQRQKLISTAERASNSGATALDEDVLVSSDGSEVRLNQVEAEARCEDVLSRESAADNSTITFFDCRVDDATNPREIVANVTGTVSYGVIASWLGVASQEFNVSSPARPSCSDSGDPVSGSC